MRLTALFVLTALLLPYGASAAFPTVVTQDEVRTKYEWVGQGGEKLKVLLMPGHEPGYGGAVLGDLKERDIAVDIANKVANELRTDPRLEVTVARDQLVWLPELQDYFTDEWDSIEDFVKGKKRLFNRAIKKGDIEAREFEPAHNTAATDVALRLYGITKWASEEGYDVVIHIHLNDTGAQNHQGFAVYVPDKEFGNAAASYPLGEAIAFELNKYNASSTLPIENYGVVEDQSLIALGAYNTADFPSVLVEYAYIYEGKIKNTEVRDLTLSDMARQTARGIEKYVGAPVMKSDTAVLPYAWKEGVSLTTPHPQAYALQVALKKLGFYPPQGELLLGCPITGLMDTCTTRALKAFQAAKGLEQTGAIGPKTKAALTAAGV